MGRLKSRAQDGYYNFKMDLFAAGCLLLSFANAAPCLLFVSSLQSAGKLFYCKTHYHY